ncbi:MAG: Ni/Fe-hydrogenase cytochrome b subunit [candidate division Zixibacteria bacterium]|nr:Ni/Fe-hydrogenase cytochrome b subunit [candidate division Zixibacteria bacterium]
MNPARDTRTNRTRRTSRGGGTMAEKIKKLTFWNVMFGLIVIVGVIATIRRFALGLGATTGLSDAVPWGMWIGFDVMSGVALAAGGFTISALVYIFNLKEFKPIVRPAILTAFLGYILVAVGLLFDLGRPWFIWHPIIFHNPHSVMLEVAWCVMLYLTVLALEFFPAFLERYRLTKAVKVIKIATPVLVIAGVLLSTLHQSSLGSLFLIVPHKLHPLWYSTRLPWLFYTSAIAIGFGMVIVESYLSSRAFGKSLERHIVIDLSRAMLVSLVFLAVLRVQDLIARDALHYMFQGTFEAQMFWIENALLIIIPVTLVAIRRIRHHPMGPYFAGLSAVMGLVMNRMNVAVTGMSAHTGYYWPSWEEIMITVFLVTLGFAAFAWAIRNLPVFGHTPWREVVYVNPLQKTPASEQSPALHPANAWLR